MAIIHRERMLEALAAYQPLTLPPGAAQPAAVLVPLRDAGEHLEVILTRRSPELEDHAGQVAFPGGRLEPGETPEQGALREANEELAIPSERVRRVGRLDDMLTITGFHVVPVVGRVPADVSLVPNPREVARVFAVPLGDLMRRERWEQREHVYRGSRVLVWHFPYDGEDVWGATAIMLRGMIELLWEEDVSKGEG